MPSFCEGKQRLFSQFFCGRYYKRHIFFAAYMGQKTFFVSSLFVSPGITRTISNKRNKKLTAALDSTYIGDFLPLFDICQIEVKHCFFCRRIEYYVGSKSNCILIAADVRNTVTLVHLFFSIPTDCGFPHISISSFFRNSNNTYTTEKSSISLFF